MNYGIPVWNLSLSYLKFLYMLKKNDIIISNEYSLSLHETSEINAINSIGDMSWLHLLRSVWTKVHQNQFIKLYSFKYLK